MLQLPLQRFPEGAPLDVKERVVGAIASYYLAGRLIEAALVMGQLVAPFGQLVDRRDLMQPEAAQCLDGEVLGEALVDPGGLWSCAASAEDVYRLVGRGAQQAQGSLWRRLASIGGVQS